MKPDSASILLNLIIEKSVSGLPRKNQLLMDELIARAPDPAQAAIELQQFEIAVAALDFANMPASKRNILCDRLRQSGNLVKNNNEPFANEPIPNALDRRVTRLGPRNYEMPVALRQEIIADGMAYVDKAFGSGNRKSNNNSLEKSITMAVDSGSEMESEGSLGEMHRFADESFGEFRPRGVHIGRRNSLGPMASMARAAAVRLGKLGSSVSRIPKVREVGTLFVAAAGLLALALFLRQQPDPVDMTGASKFALVEDEASRLIWMDDKSVNSYQREKFLTNPPVDMIRVTCTTESQKDAMGELLWSNSQQKGFASLSGLEVNDPDEFQYQVWIVDANQKYPVTGGVFNVVDQKGAVIRLRPNLKIKQAVEFVVTQERPGGVVASSRENIVAVATIGK